MNTAITYIFKHKHYKDVISKYQEVIVNYYSALSVWATYINFTRNSSFESKEFIATNISTIKKVAAWINNYENLRKTSNEGLKWFFSETGYSEAPIMSYREYKLVAEQVIEIKKLQNYEDIYCQLVSKHKEATERFIGKKAETHSYLEKKDIALHKKEVQNISSILRTAQLCEAEYPRAWKYFSKDRPLYSIPLDELETIQDTDFCSKDEFLRLYENNPELIKIILGPNLIPIHSFNKDAIEQEEAIVNILASESNSTIEKFNESIQLGNTNEHKCAILDSLVYGDNFHDFADSFSINDFYQLRKKFDNLGVHFDVAAQKTKENKDYIKAFNNAKSGNNVIYIQDYLRIVTEGSDLYEYVTRYSEETERREKAQRLQINYPKGFKALFCITNLDTCPVSEILTILNAEERIRAKDRILKEQEKHFEEVARKKQELRELKSCVSSWPQPTRSMVNCFSLYYYYPTNCVWVASEDEWDVRNLIWDFKANPNKPQSESEIISRHKTAMMEIIPDLERVIDYFFGNRKNKLTLVCIPSSKRVVTQRRYKDLSEELCKTTGMTNGYDYVNVSSEGEARHLGGTNQAQFSVDANFFKDRYVILFDDVITSGASMERFKRLLETNGAKVIGGLSIGKTKHERQSHNPIELI